MFAYTRQEQKSKNTVQKKNQDNKTSTPNLTKVSDKMKTNFEHFSAPSFSDVRTNYNSNKPTQLQGIKLNNNEALEAPANAMDEAVQIMSYGRLLEDKEALQMRLADGHSVIQMMKCPHCGKDPCDGSCKQHTKSTFNKEGKRGESIPITNSRLTSITNSNPISRRNPSIRAIPKQNLGTVSKCNTNFFSRNIIRTNPTPCYPTPCYPTPSYPTPCYPTPCYPTPCYPTPCYPTPSYPTPNLGTASQKKTGRLLEPIPKFDMKHYSRKNVRARPNANPIPNPVPILNVAQKPPITGDGNCLYHAVFRAMHPTAGPAAGAHLRLKAYLWFSTSPIETKLSLLDFLSTQEKPKKELVNSTINTEIEELLRDLLKDREWTGERSDLAPCILADTLGIILTIIDTLNNRTQIFGSGEKPNVTIYYNGIDHYEDTAPLSILMIKNNINQDASQIPPKPTDSPDVNRIPSQEELEYNAMENIVLRDEWNDPIFVNTIGAMSWKKVKILWNSFKKIWSKSDQGDKINKFILVRLRNNKKKTKPFSYEKWPETLNYKEQSGKMWGTETEGGGITVFLKTAYQGEQNISLLKKELTYFKRTALVNTNYGTLALDNVSPLLDDLLAGKSVSLPLEVASHPRAAGATNLENIQTMRKSSLIAAEGRDKKTWPTVAVVNQQLISKCGDAIALDRFNKYFVVVGMQPISIRIKPQHVTTSGLIENRMAMGLELMNTAIEFESGTRGKSALSGKPKTSLELLRHPSITGLQMNTLEAYANIIHKQLTKKLKKDTKFADDCLNAILIPSTGVPREIGGYTLLTPMTNAFPLIALDKTKNEITVLREYR